jgi:hypothetical protein
MKAFNFVIPVLLLFLVSEPHFGGMSVQASGKSAAIELHCNKKLTSLPPPHTQNSCGDLPFQLFESWPMQHDRSLLL